MKKIAKILLVGYLAILLNGCAGMIADSMVRATATGNTYAELAPLSTPANSNGRVYIYRTETSTKNSLVFGKGISKNYLFCVVDDQGFWLLWDVFMYKDLPAGLHEISCSTKSRQRGDQKILLPVKSGEDLYVRIDIIEDQIIPVLVDSAIAKSEIADLPILETDDPKKWERVE